MIECVRARARLPLCECLCWWLRSQDTGMPVCVNFCFSLDNSKRTILINVIRDQAPSISHEKNFRCSRCAALDRYKYILFKHETETNTITFIAPYNIRIRFKTFLYVRYIHLKKKFDKIEKKTITAVHAGWYVLWRQ